MYTKILIASLNVGLCTCLAGYEIFRGFDAPLITGVFRRTSRAPEPQTMESHSGQDYNDQQPQAQVRGNWSRIISTTRARGNLTTGNKTEIKLACIEDEKPTNIGPYEVPTQRDLILFIKQALKRTYAAYRRKALYFLNDIKKASRATQDVEKECMINKILYRQCVKQTSNEFEAMAKETVKQIEKTKQEGFDFTENTVICKLSAFKRDPLELIKLIATEESALDFALPAFLRMLHSCSNYCASSLKGAIPHGGGIPLPRISDIDIVLKHFLENKRKENLVPLKQKQAHGTHS